MARKQYEQFCLRFSMENPTHVKLFRIINNLDSDIYRSKNQFIMEALEAYVSGKSIDELCKKEKQEEEAPLTKQDLLEFGNQMREDLKQELYQEMLVRIADTMMSAIMRQPNGMQEQADQTETVSQKKEQTASEEMVDNEMGMIGGMVMVRRVISTIMVFLLSVIKGGAWLGLHLLLVVLEILKIFFLISCDILKVMLLILSCGRMERR